MCWGILSNPLQFLILIDLAYSIMCSRVKHILWTQLTLRLALYTKKLKNGFLKKIPYPCPPPSPDPPHTFLRALFGNAFFICVFKPPSNFWTQIKWNFDLVHFNMKKNSSFPTTHPHQSVSSENVYCSIFAIHRSDLQ